MLIEVVQVEARDIEFRGVPNQYEPIAIAYRMSVILTGVSFLTYLNALSSCWMVYTFGIRLYTLSAFLITSLNNSFFFHIRALYGQHLESSFTSICLMRRR